MNSIEVSEADFQEIYDFWKNFLWAGRRSKIEACSSMKYLGGYDLSIKKFGKPRFWKATREGKIIGVNSGHSTSMKDFRSRGLWIHPNFRNQGNAQKLLQAVKEEAIIRECEYVWSVPRKEAINAYLKFGFQITSDWFNSGMEFGPNCYVKLDLP